MSCSHTPLRAPCGCRWPCHRPCQRSLEHPSDRLRSRRADLIDRVAGLTTAECERIDQRPPRDPPPDRPASSGTSGRSGVHIKDHSIDDPVRPHPGRPGDPLPAYCGADHLGRSLPPQGTSLPGSAISPCFAPVVVFPGASPRTVTRRHVGSVRSTTWSASSSRRSLPVATNRV